MLARTLIIFMIISYPLDSINRNSQQLGIALRIQLNIARPSVYSDQELADRQGYS